MLAYATHACIIAIHLLLAQDNKKMSKEPMHRLTTKEEAEKIMEGLESNHKMEDLIEAMSGGTWIRP